MSKFWKVVNKANGKNAEILIYGNIVDKRGWSSDGTAPDGFAEDLRKLNGCPLTLRINSSGGSVFAAHAIHNLIKSYAGPVTAVIDGIAASAATIIAMAAEKVVMPSNSMMMIHDPMIGLNGYHNEEDLEDFLNALKKIKESIVSSYLGRSKLSAEALSRMMKASTWLTAKECLDMGFADEIVGRVDAVLDGNILVVNQIQHTLTDDDVKQIKDKMEVNAQMDESKAFKAFWQNLCAMLGIAVNTAEPVVPAANVIKPQTENEAPPEGEATPAAPVDAVAAERSRMLALEAADNGNAIIHKMIDYAKKNGQTVDEIKPYLDIINEHKDQAPQLVQNMITDNQESGVDQVTGQPGAGMSEEEKDRIQADNMAEMMKKMHGGK